MGEETPLLTFEGHGEIVLGSVHAASVLDAVNVGQFGEEVLTHVQEHPKINLLLDFHDVQYLSSAVLSQLLRINRAIGDGKGHFRLCALNQNVRKVFSITNLDRFFVIYDSPEEAVNRFERSLQVEEQDEAWTHFDV
jgi:anti-sigma B factor antagonist